MSIVLPEDQAENARQRAAERGISPEQYLAELVEQDAFQAYWATLTPEEKSAHQEFERLLDNAVASGPPIPADEAYRRTMEWLHERRARRADR